MTTLSWIAAAVIFAVGTIIGMVFVFTIINKLGTLYINSEASEETGVAKFSFDKPLEYAAEHRLMWVRIEKS